MDSSISTSGAVIFWNTGPVTRDSLARALPPGTAIPERRSPTTALKEVLEKLYKGGSVFVRPVNANAGLFDIAKQEGAGRGNNYFSMASVSVSDSPVNGPTVRVERNPYGFLDGEEGKIQRRLDVHMEEISSSQVSGVLSDWVTVKLRAVSLRPGGGVYWIPTASVEEYRRVAARMPKGVRLHSTTTVIDDSTVSAVADAVIGEIKATMTQVQEDFSHMRPDSRMVANRRAQLEQAQSRLSELAGIFGPIFDSAERALSAAIVAVAGCSETTADLFTSNGIDLDGIFADTSQSAASDTGTDTTPADTGTDASDFGDTDFTAGL